MTPWHTLIWLVLAAIFAVIGTQIGRTKGRPVLGAWLGALLGLIGLLIIALVPKTHERKVEEAMQRQEIETAARQRGLS